MGPGSGRSNSIPSMGTGEDRSKPMADKSDSFQANIGTAVPSSNTSAPTEKPKEEWWYDVITDTTRWNKLYNYELLIVKSEKPKAPTGGALGAAVSAASKMAGMGDGVTFKIADSGLMQLTKSTALRLPLPIPPEALSLSTPFAINTHVTLGGIIEEHNGAPIRMINIQGTTGLTPMKDSSPGQPGPMGFFHNTIQQATAIRNAGADVLNAYAGKGPLPPNLMNIGELDTSNTTGYYAFHNLRKFLEYYAAQKKAGRSDLHLALAMWKDQAVYLVTPVSFDMLRDAGSPLEYRYNMQFKAWRRIRLDGGAAGLLVKATSIKRSASYLSRAVNTLRAARRAINLIGGLGPALQKDFDRSVGEPLREAEMLCLDALGAAQTLACLPKAMLKQGVGYWMQAFDTLPKNVAAAGRNVGENVKKAYTSWDERKSTGPTPEGGATSRYQGTQQGANPKIWDDYDTASQVNPGELNLPLALRNQIAAEVARVNSKTRADFEKEVTQARAALDKLAAQLGVSDDTYNSTLGVPSSGVNVRHRLSASEWESLFAIEAGLGVLRGLAASDDGGGVTPARVNSIDQMSTLARRSGIAFQVPTSKYAIPYPYGATLEQLAQQYLGDADRWHEIAALNGLREPYVDEVGFTLPFATNGNGNEITLASTSQVYVGQSVYISSRTMTRTHRHVLSVKQMPTVTVITVDGDANMSSYLVADGALLSAFLPDTINSQNLIYLPSTSQPINSPNVTKSIPGVSEFDPMVAVGGVDLLLNQNNDLIITPDGDARLAIGLTNIVQHVKLALSVQQGRLLNHPSYGLPITVGDSTADVDVQRLGDSIRDMFAQDPMFRSVDAVRIEKSGGTCKISVAVTPNGTDVPVPISFDIKR